MCENRCKSRHWWEAQTDKRSCKMTSKLKQSICVKELMKENTVGALSPLSGHCLNKGAQRAASADPSSSTEPERSSWPICNTEKETNVKQPSNPHIKGSFEIYTNHKGTETVVSYKYSLVAGGSSGEHIRLQSGEEALLVAPLADLHVQQVGVQGSVVDLWDSHLNGFLCGGVWGVHKSAEGLYHHVSKSPYFYCWDVSVWLNVFFLSFSWI